jgi:uncharacterized damage-inducible protein DinB
MTAEPPDNPAGPFVLVESYDEVAKRRFIETIHQAPSRLRDAVSNLADSQLDTLYKNWTVRQIVHHIADSHVHVYIRFKWALTEDNPTIKAYEEADWVLLNDSKLGAVEPSLALLDGLHAKWVQLIESMTQQQFARTFLHPQSGETVDLWSALNYYPWHSLHHTGQILWLREQHGWPRH